MWPFPKRISATDLKTLPNPDTLEEAPTEADDTRLKKLLLWRREYSQLYTVPPKQVITVNQLRWMLIFLDENYTVEEALEKAGVENSRAFLIHDDIEEALESVDGTPAIVALREEYYEDQETDNLDKLN